MPDDRDPINGEDGSLDELLKIAVAFDDPDFVRPPVEAIHAYLHGEATSEQTALVRSALLASSSFRKEIIESAKVLDSLSRPVRRHADSRIQISTPHSLAEFLSSMEHQQVTEVKTSQQPEQESVFRRASALLKHYFVPDFDSGMGRFATSISGAAAVVLVAAASISIFLNSDETSSRRQLPVLELRSVGELDAGLFVSSVTRGPGTGHIERRQYRSEMESVEAAFAGIIAYEDGRFDFLAPDSADSPHEPEVTVSVVQMSDERNQLREITGEFPRTDGFVPSSIKLWQLSLPGLELQAAEIPSDSAAIRVSGLDSAQSVFVFSARYDSMWVAVRGKIQD